MAHNCKYNERNALCRCATTDGRCKAGFATWVQLMMASDLRPHGLFSRAFSQGNCALSSSQVPKLPSPRSPNLFPPSLKSSLMLLKISSVEISSSKSSTLTWEAMKIIEIDWDHFICATEDVETLKACTNEGIIKWGKSGSEGQTTPKLLSLHL